MQVVSVDLDNTLIRTHSDYRESKSTFGEWMEEEFGVDSDSAVDTLDKKDKERILELGLKMELVPTSFVETLKHYVDSPKEEHIDHARDLGYSIFKSKEEYEERGFMEGAESMLNKLEETANSIHLVTVGDERVQEPKIQALGLRERMDSIHVVPYLNDHRFEQSKTKALYEIYQMTGVDKEDMWHIGDSVSSDIKAATELEINAVNLKTNTDFLTDKDHEIDGNVHYFDTHNCFLNNFHHII